MKSLATIIFCFFALILTAQSPFGHTANAEVMESDPVYLAKQTAKIKAGLSRNFHTDAGQEIVKTGGTQLWVQFADGTGEAMLLDFAQYGYTSLGHPVWSADGTQIAVSAKIGLNKADLIVLNADGSNARVLANFVQTWAVWMDLEDLSWRMDGQEIAGVLQVRENAWTDNGMFLFQHNLNTGETSYYTDYYCDGVSHAPNSSRLAYSLNTSLLDKNEVQVWNYADNTYETWEEDIRLEYGSHRRYSLISLTWSTESSILITIQLIDVFAADVYTYHVFRVEKIGENQFQTKFLFNTGAARPHLTSSPDGTTIYTSVVQNNKINMYQVYLQP
ncbi:MAG: TolB family protein, partial [Saprospiraceae bacterium]